MNDEFETTNFDEVCQFIKPLLNNEYEVKVTQDCEGVYGVNYCCPRYISEHFVLYNGEDNTLDGEKIEFIEENDIAK